jgi:hypothetical protein
MVRLASILTLPCAAVGSRNGSGAVGWVYAAASVGELVAEAGALEAFSLQPLPSTVFLWGLDYSPALPPFDSWSSLLCLVSQAPAAQE